MPTKPKTPPIPLLITTLHKGVFFGYGRVSTDKTIRITSARMCIYWDVSMKGVTGLATVGPGPECRIGMTVPAITLQDVTAVLEVSKEAEAKWIQ